MSLTQPASRDPQDGQAGAAGKGPAQAPARPRRRPGRPTLSNEELLDKALDLFLEKGFDGTSIDAITASAGMAKRTVYARYGDKENLFRAALSRAIDDWIVPIDSLSAAECDDIRETLVRIGRMLVTNVLSPAGLRLLRLTNAESVRMPDVATENVRRGTQPTLAYLSGLFARRFPGRDDVEDAAQAFLNIVVGGPASNAAWGMRIETEEVERHTRYAVTLFLDGFVARAEREASGGDDRREALMREAAQKLDEARARLDEAARLGGG